MRLFFDGEGHSSRRAPTAPNRPEPGPIVKSLEQIEAEVKAFEIKERHRLGLVEKAIDHWFDANPQDFKRSQRETTTLLFGGLTEAQDFLIGAALRGLGYKVMPMTTPDNESLRYGKEFGNRGQCNPTYFTVGNLVKSLSLLESEKGLTKAEIVRDYIFLTAGSCGPCRFGTYSTEYRKALRDAGFDGFRVMLFQDNGGLSQACGEEAGLQLNAGFFIPVLKAILVGDILNVAGYRLRPYEVVKGSTDSAITACKSIMSDCFSKKTNLLLALRRCGKLLRAIEVNNLQAKPKVSIIGEFWAMTTEGDGNYRLQRFLEGEGAEVDTTMLMSWLLYSTWQLRWDTRRRMLLRKHDRASNGLDGVNVRKRMALLHVAEFALHTVFKIYCRAIGLKNVKLPNMDEIATVSHQYYDNHLRGGEGHVEVGKLIMSAKKRKAHMVISVKPFGCMPSSGISDGVQSLVAERYPEAIFCAVETTGDAAVNMQSRVQMQLFKAKQLAVAELDKQLTQAGLTLDEAHKKMQRRGFNRAMAYPGIEGIAGTAARFVAGLRWRTTFRRAAAARSPAPAQVKS